jgi:hypothetical protein
MVEVLIAEMFGSDRIDPTDYQRAVVVDGRGSKENEEDHSQEWMAKCAQKEFDRASIVRDVR